MGREPFGWTVHRPDSLADSRYWQNAAVWFLIFAVPATALVGVEYFGARSRLGRWLKHLT